MYKIKKLVPVGYIVLLFLMLAVVVRPKVSAIDSSFQAEATATLSCSTTDPLKKRLEKFEHNAPGGSTVTILPVDDPDVSGGVAFGEPISVGGEVAGEAPRIFWSIKDVLLGPWEANVVLDKSCGSNATTVPDSWMRRLLPGVGLGAAILLVGGTIGYRLAKRKK